VPSRFEHLALGLDPVAAFSELAQCRADEHRPEQPAVERVDVRDEGAADPAERTFRRAGSGSPSSYVLREAFDYPYRQISDVLATSEANARQLVTRARLRLAGERRGQASAAEQQRFTDAFVEAAQTGDLTTLEQLLAAHVVPSPPLAIAA
jgi:hypothetical protein